MARKTKLTPSVQEKICEALRRGHYMNTAAPYGGVSARTAQSWLARGHEEEKRIQRGEKANRKETIYLNFMIATEEATSHPVDVALRTLEHELENNPKTAKWFLTHRLSGNWSKFDEFNEMLDEIQKIIKELRDDTIDKTP